MYLVCLNAKHWLSGSSCDYVGLPRIAFNEQRAIAAAIEISLETAVRAKSLTLLLAGKVEHDQLVVCYAVII